MTNTVLRITLTLALSFSALVAEGAPQAESSPENPFHENLGVGSPSLKIDGDIIWGASVIKGDDGRYYMFASRWSKSVGMGNWITNSEVILASSDTPAGPYEFEKVALPDRGKSYWDGMATHNPTIRKHDGKYYLFYTGTTFDFEKPTKSVSRALYGKAWNNKRIGIAVSDSPQGPWVRSDKPIIEPRPGKWDAAITSNASPIIRDDGSVLLIYKSAPYPYPERNQKSKRGLSFGLAEAPEISGPYTRINGGQKVEFKGAKNMHVEDPYAWFHDGTYHMIAKAFSGKVTGESGAGFYAHSKDGFVWSIGDKPKAYSRSVMLENGEKVAHQKLERPQVLIEEGKPTHIFFASRVTPKSEIFNLVIPVKQTE